MSGDGVDDRALERLLKRLAEPGIVAVPSPLGCGRVALIRRDGSATLGAGYVEAALVDRLIALGAVAWSGEDRNRRLDLLARDGEARTLAIARPVGDEISAPVLVDERESPLLWLYRRPGRDGRPQIDDAAFAAGERFRADMTLAGAMPRVTMNWDAAFAPDERTPGPRGPADASDSTLAARQRVRQACELLGPEMAGLAIDVCGFLKGLEQVERERGWPARSAKLVLRIALATLARHYRIAPAASAAARSWRAPDARPVIEPAA